VRFLIIDPIIDQLGGWLRDVRAERIQEKDRVAAEEDQRSAQVLHDASILIVSMQAYDNNARLAYRRAYLFATQEPVANEDSAIREDRRKAYRNLQDFEDQEQIYRRADRALASLHGQSKLPPESDEEVALSALLVYGDEFQTLTHDVRDAKLKYSEESRYGYGTGEYGRALANGVPSKSVARYAQRMISRVAALRPLLDDADKAYADLCAAVRRQHNLPPLPVIEP
jgi:hypothetical protein